MNLLRAAALTLTLFVAGSVAAHAEEWLTDHAAAVKASKEQHKPIMMFFTGSDWCGWCKRLQAEVLTKDEFKTFAAQNLILLELDFPRGKEQSKEIKAQNPILQDDHQVQGYPTCVFVDASGKPKGTVGYVQGGPAAWIAEVEKVLR